MTLTLSASDALALATQFRTASIAVGDYLYAPENWPNFPPNEKTVLQSLEVTLLNVASDLVTQAVGVIIEDAGQSAAELVAAAGKARKALKKIKDIKKVITIVTALIGLAAVIPTGNANTIYGALKNLHTAVTPDEEAAAHALTVATDGKDQQTNGTV